MRVILFIFLFSIGPLCSGQRANELRILTGIHLGVDRARIASPGASPFRTNPWLAASIELGASLVHRNRWGLGLSGAISGNGYSYAKENARYNVFHITERTEMQFHWMLPLGSGDRTFVRLGTGFGVSFQGKGSVGSYEAAFSAFSSAESRAALYMAPEATVFFKMGKHRLEGGFRYLRHFDRSPASQTVLLNGGSTTIATATNDHIGLVFRFHMGFMKRPPPPKPVPEVAYIERRTEMLTSMSTHWDHITLELMDNAEYDGDSISVYMNDEPVLVGYELTKRKKKITIPVPYGANTLLVVAHNEGRVPPNTASCILRRGKGRERLLIRTTKELNTAVEIIRE